MVLNKAFLKIDVFRSHMDNLLARNLSDYLLSTLSNMLGLHYAADEKLQKVEQDIPKYAGNLAKKLSDFLGEEVVLDETFDMAMNLFIVALSPTMPEREDPPSLKNNRDMVVSAVGNLCFGDDVADMSEKKKLASAIDNMIDDEKAHQMLGAVAEHPNLLRGMVQQNIPIDQIKSNMLKAANSSAKQNYILADYAMFAGIALCGALGLASGFAAATYVGAVASVSVVPAAAIALRYGTRIGENIGERLAEFEKDFKTSSKALSTMIGDFIPSMSKEHSRSMQEPAQGQDKTLSREKAKEIEGQNKDLSDMIKEFSSHVSSKQDIEKAKNLKIEKVQSQSKSIERR